MADPNANLAETLAMGSVVLDNDGYAWQRVDDGWRCAQKGLDDAIESELLCAWYGISRLLWRAEYGFAFGV